MANVTIFCFLASYGLALAVELYHHWRAGRLPHALSLALVAAGLLAHTIYLLHHGLPMQAEPSSLLVLAWILGVFSLVGSFHHRRLAWGVFVLPVVLGLVALAWVVPEVTNPTNPLTLGPSPGWIYLHLFLMLSGAAGLGVATVASVMYLFQSARLRTKYLPGEGMKLLSLERLEDMNRRAVVLAFPLFTCGLALGFVLLLTTAMPFDWTDPKVVAASLLWLDFAVLVYLRFGLNQRGRKVAWWTLTAFGLMVVAFAVHFFVESGHRFG
jgi:ABC-type uncharacterized transport system permease subunit